MELDKLKECIGHCEQAYQILEVDKADCNDQVEAAIDELVNSSKLSITKDDRASIKDVAKALSSEKVEELAEKISSKWDILEASGVVDGGDLSLIGFKARQVSAQEKLDKQMSLDFT